MTCKHENADHLIPGMWWTCGQRCPPSLIRVAKFLSGEELSPTEIATMRAYLRQWMAGDFQGHEAAELRARVETIVDMWSLNTWVEDALDAGVDPL